MTASWVLASFLWLAQGASAQSTAARSTAIDTCALTQWAVGSGPKPGTLDVEVTALQERSTQPGRRVYKDVHSELWLRPLKGGEYTVAVMNLADHPVAPDIVWNELGILKQRGESPRVRDVLRRENLGKIHGGFAHRLEPGQCALFHVKP